MQTALSFDTLLDSMSTHAITKSERISAIQKGFSPSIVYEVGEQLHEPKSRIVQLIGVPSTTLHRLSEKKQSLELGPSERIDRVAEIITLATDTFRDKGKGIQWLKTPNSLLGNKEPLYVLDTELGAQEVRRLLGSIMFGGVA